MICCDESRLFDWATWSVVLVYVLIAPPAAFCAFIGILLITVGGAFPIFVTEPLFAQLESKSPLVMLFWIIGGYLAAHAMALIVGAIMVPISRRVRHVALLSALSVVISICVPSFLATTVGAMPPHPLNWPTQTLITGCGAVAGVVCALAIHQLRRSGRLA